MIFAGGTFVVFLMEPNQTPYDLRFQLFGIPVRVHPMFWLMSAILGWSAIDVGGIPFVLIWIACVFVSILIHEFGHVLMGMVFGARGRIVLYTFGGLAAQSNTLSTWWKRVLVCLAGPVAGFLFLGLVILLVRIALPDEFFVYMNLIKGRYLGIDFIDPNYLPEVARVVRSPTMRDETLLNLFWINLFWGLVNLLPVWPLDGGQVSRDVCVRFVPDHGYRMSLGISFLLAAVLAINGLVKHFGHKGIPYLPGGIWIAIIFGLMAFQSFQLLQQRSGHDPYDPWMGQGRPWER